MLTSIYVRFRKFRLFVIEETKEWFNRLYTHKEHIKFEWMRISIIERMLLHLFVPLCIMFNVLKVSDFKRKSIHVSARTRMKTTFETWKNISIQRLSNLISLVLVSYHLSRVEIIHFNWKLKRIFKPF